METWVICANDSDIASSLRPPDLALFPYKCALELMRVCVTCIEDFMETSFRPDEGGGAGNRLSCPSLIGTDDHWMKHGKSDIFFGWGRVEVVAQEGSCLRTDWRSVGRCVGRWSHFDSSGLQKSSWRGCKAVSYTGSFTSTLNALHVAQSLIISWPGWFWSQNMQYCMWGRTVLS